MKAKKNELHPLTPAQYPTEGLGFTPHPLTPVEPIAPTPPKEQGTFEGPLPGGPAEPIAPTPSKEQGTFEGPLLPKILPPVRLTPVERPTLSGSKRPHSEISTNKQEPAAKRRKLSGGVKL